MKKIVSLLAIVALLAVCAVAGFATGEPTLVINDQEGVAGDLITFEVTIENNPGFSVAEMIITLDNALEFAPVNAAGDYAEFAPGFVGVLNPASGFVTFAAMNDLFDENALVVKFIVKVKEGTLPGEYPVSVYVDYMENLDGIVMEYVEFTANVIVPCNDHVAGEPVVENEVPASCTAEGSYDEVVYCTLCGEEMSRETKTTEKLAHTAGNAVVENEVPATCQTAGSYELATYCSVCGTEMSRETVATEKLAHTPAEAVIENEFAGSCLMNGSYDEVVYCSVCGEEISRTTVETELGEHVAADAVKENIENADCVTPGSYDLVVYCSVCGEELSREHVEGELGDHVAGDVVIENEVAGANCQTAGSYDEVVYCTVCGEELSRETKEGKVGEHQVETVVTEPNCCFAGKSTQQCALCGEVFSETVLPATGEHVKDYIDNEDGKTHKVICTNTNEVLNAAENHTYGEFVEDVENPGWKFKVCEQCGYIHREGATPPPTGDNSVIALVVATLSVMGIAVVASKKKEF